MALKEFGVPGFDALVANADSDHLDTLELFNRLLREQRPFTHLRYADGEFMSIVGTSRSSFNADKHSYFHDTLGIALAKTLATAAAKFDPDLYVGADFVAGGKEWAIENNLKSKINWTASQVFVAGITSLATLEFLRIIRADNRRKVLVACRESAPAARSLLATHIEIPARDCWLSSGDVRPQFDHQAKLNADTIFLFAAGMSSCVWGYELHRQYPAATIIDIGHLLSGAFGDHRRRWLKVKNCERWRAYEQLYIPLIRGDV